MTVHLPHQQNLSDPLSSIPLLLHNWHDSFVRIPRRTEMSAALLLNPQHPSISALITSSSHVRTSRRRRRLSSFTLSPRHRIICSSSSTSEPNSISSGDDNPRIWFVVLVMGKCLDLKRYILGIEFGIACRLSKDRGIEGPGTVQGFMKMQAQEIDDNIKSRRNKLFLLMEEAHQVMTVQVLPVTYLGFWYALTQTPKTLRQLYLTSFSMISGIILFRAGLKLGIGGTSYKDFIWSMHLPLHLSQVDPILASLGRSVGVISALMLIEANNVVQQEKKRCKYCHGTGYLACSRCSASGMCVKTEPISKYNNTDHPLRVPTTQRCSSCSGAGKVMCPSVPMVTDLLFSRPCGT
ncbi:ORANGE-LIKE, chloroplastic-like protein [Drosera capensis]